MPDVSAADLAYCSQLAMLPSSTFPVSYRFAPREFASRILALKAFCNQVRSIPAEVSDPSVGLLKLAWWKKETSGEARLSSQHPVVRAMRDSGLLECLDPDCLERYFSGIADFMQADSYEDEAALFELAKEIGGREALLETCSSTQRADDTAVETIGAASFLFRAIRNPRLRKCSESWWVPLSLQARYGISLGIFSEDAAEASWRELVVLLCQTARKWIVSGTSELGSRAPRICHHLLIDTALKQRCLDRVLRGPRKDLDRPIGRPKIGDVVVAWNTARRLNRAGD